VLDVVDQSERHVLDIDERDGDDPAVGQQVLN
jgi:hypothetical protein